MKAAKHIRANARVALAGSLALIAIAVAPSVSQATQLHTFSSAFGSAGQGAGQISLLARQGREGPAGSGLAVNDETGNVYIADTGNHRVSEFGPDGSFIGAFGADVGGPGIDVCTTLCVAGTSGSEPGQLAYPTFIAVDNSAGPSHGDVYVADSADNLISKFTAAGTLIASWSDEGQLSGTSVLAAGTGNLTAGSAEITGLIQSTGEFLGGMEVSGEGVPVGTYILESPAGVLRLSQPVTLTKAGVALSGRYSFTSFGHVIEGVTVDRSGHLWVAAFFAHLLEFDQVGGTLKTLDVRGLHPVGIVIDPSGRLSAAGSFENIERFNTAGGAVEGVLLGDPSPTGLAISPGTGDLYFDAAGSSILEVSSQCEPSDGGCAPSQSFGAGHLTEGAGLAVAPDGTLYAADTGSGRVAVFAVSLEANTEAATEAKATSVVLQAFVDPRGGEVSACRFQSGPSKGYGRSLPCLNEAGEEVGTASKPITAPTAVHAEATGLKAGAVYHYRLRAINAAGEEIHSEDREAETLVLPRIEAEEAVEVTAGSATLKAKVNPRGLAVSSCKVEWGASTAYGADVPCEPSSIALGTVAVPIGAHLVGLQAGVTYHWRVAATDANGTETSSDNTFVYLPGPPSAEVSQDCENESLREVNGSTALPDCRAYELVTPAHKNGATVGAIFGSLQTNVSQDGSRLLASTAQCFGDAPSCGVVRQTTGAAYEFSRSTSGWGTSALVPSAGQFTASTVLLQNANAADQLLSVALPASPPAHGREWLYIRHGDGSLASIGPVAPEAGYFKGSYFGGLVATADLSHFAYEADHPFWPSFDQTQAGESIYEYAGAAEHPFLVAVSGGQGSNDLIGACGSGLVGKEENRALSADGRTIYFTVRPCPNGTGANAGVGVPADTIYARIDGESADARTVRISGPAPESACDSACQAQPPAPANFAGGSADGSRIYFESTQQLSDDATQGSENLYLYSDPQEQPLTGDHLTDVSAGDTSGQGPQVQGVMAISPDGSRAYFVAKGVLAGANADGAEPEEGANNLYVHDAEAGTNRFIATLPGAEPELRQWRSGFTTANVTPDGRYLLFTSRGGLTADATREDGPAQVYRYDAVAQHLTRVSIGQRGFADNGNAGSGGAAIASAGSAQFSVTGRPPLNPSISADGSRVFFESPIGLTPGALDDVAINNRGALAENIYEWEEEGAGGCAQADGCVYLISDGRDVTEGSGTASSVELIGTDEKGENVFFGTADPLVPADVDTGRDVYVARVKGGFAPPSAPVPCQGDACKGPGSQPGAEASPGTPVFSGPSEGPNNPQKSKKKPKKNHKHKPKKHGKKSHRRATGNQSGGGK